MYRNLSQGFRGILSASSDNAKSTTTWVNDGDPLTCATHQ